VIDSFLLARIGEKSVKGVQPAVGVLNGLASPVEEWVNAFIASGEGECILRADGRLNPERYIDYIENVFAGLAERGNVIIVGRGGQCILRNQEQAFHVCLMADMEFRIDRMKRSVRVSDEEAMARLLHSDAMRRDFVSRYFSGNWDDPQSYHLVVNTGRVGLDESAELIVLAVQRFISAREYVHGRKERRKSIDRRRSERRRKDRRTSGTPPMRESPEHSQGRYYSLFPPVSDSDRRQHTRRAYIRRIEDRKKIPFPVNPKHQVAFTRPGREEGA
jgi:cytidylate kinase